MTTKSAPKRAKGQSKKSKKQWRKTDIEDVEEFLEDKRLEERLGGKFDDREDKDLFVLDGKPEEPQPTKGGKRAERKKKAREGKLNCYKHLEIAGGVADPKKGGRTPRRDPSVHREAREAKLREVGIVKAKEKMAKEHRSMATKVKRATKLERSTRRRTKFDFDLWNEDGENEKVKGLKENEWLEVGTKLVNLRGTRNHQPKIPQRQVTTTLEAVEKPHGGESYNPSLKDHQDLIWKAAMVEMNKEKEMKKVEFHTTRLFPSERPCEEAKRKEMAEGICETHQESEAEEESADNDEEPEEDARKLMKPKTKKQRRKELEKKKMDAKSGRLKRERSKNQDILRVKSLKKEIKSEEERMKLNMAKKAAKKASKMREAARLSSVKFEEKDIDLKLSDELTGNLRNLKPEGNLLEDRFKSLQKRNVIESRVKQKVVKKKRNRKRVEKRSHKMGFSWEKS